MKIRSNYVSNSSSSSFIVEFKELEEIITIAGEQISVMDFFDAIESYSNSYTEETRMNKKAIDEESKEDLIETIDKTIEWVEDEDKECLITLKKDIENCPEKSFAHFNLSYHDKALNFLFKLLCKYGLFKIRYSNEE